MFFHYSKKSGKSSFLPNSARRFPFSGVRQAAPIKTDRLLPSRRNGQPAHIKISSRTTVREVAIDDLAGTGYSSCLFLP
ncbi:hypothetical protein HMPREF3038_02941 [Akkermansia sp. KLE1797]|nr:hypothetical protein HMPREF3038_02941 [Akkermansia sp. KLE1797]KXU52763.1 hypothetical protein HMPREF3039_03114 [Akkermansia sp. KLE1798]KZA04021.1 hypothetical protein HMPREF1326_02216 [Akkermansia sp. KLE1605]